MESSTEPSLREYARFYGLSEDYSLEYPIKYADASCEPQPIPPRAGLAAENPEQRMEKIKNAFCQSILEQRMPARAEDLAALQNALRPEPYNGNIWRPLLPVLKTSDLAPVPLLRTFDDNDNPPLETGFQPYRPASERFSLPPRKDPPDTGSDSYLTESDLVSVPAEFLNVIPGPNSQGETTGIDPDLTVANAELSAQSPMLPGINPINYVTVPSGPGGPAIPPETREVFDHYNFAPDPNTQHLSFPPGHSTVLAAETFMRDVDFIAGMDAPREMRESIESDTRPPSDRLHGTANFCPIHGQAFTASGVGSSQVLIAHLTQCTHMY